MLSRLLRFYKNFLLDNPFLSQTFHTGVLMGASDLACQYFVEKKNTISWRRALQFTGVGFFYVGPVRTLWFQGIHKYIVGSSAPKVILKKLFLDQVIFAPPFLASLLFSFNVLQGLSIDDSVKKLNQDYFSVLLNNFKVWPGVILINFMFVPLNFQVYIVQSFAFFWNIYMSWIAHQKLKTE